MRKKENFKILIVDDDPQLCRMLSSYLGKVHYEDINIEVKCFATGEDCLVELNNSPDVIVLDYYLNSEVPNAKSGLQILKEIRARNRSIPVFVLSSQSQMVITAEMLKAGANEYVVKDNATSMRVAGLVQKTINDKVHKRKVASRWWLAAALFIVVLLVMAVKSNT